MNPDTQSRSMLASTTDVSMPRSFTTGCARLRPGSRVAGSGRKAPVAKSSVRRARSNASSPRTLALRSSGTALDPHIAGRAIGDQQVVVQTIVAQRVDQLAGRCGRERDDVWIGGQHCEPVRAARDAVVHLALQQADDALRQIGQVGEAPLSSPPLVVAEDHERGHQRHHHQREKPCSHRRQERGDTIDDASRCPARDSCGFVAADAHELTFCTGLRDCPPRAKLQSTRGKP